MRAKRLKQWSAANWFLIVAPALAGCALLISRSVAWPQHGAEFEAALLIDATITLPVLYGLCYAKSLPAWQLAVRMLAIACLGIYLLSLMIPPEGRSLLPGFAWARAIGLAVLVLIELRVLVAALRLVFRSGTSVEQLSAETGAPPIVAKLMLLEARLWKGLWRFFRRR